MSTSRTEAPEVDESLTQAEDVAASVDAAASQAVEDEASEGDATEIALDSAAMVAEGGPVAEPADDEAAAGTPAGEETAPDASAAPAKAEEPVESLAAAALRNNWGPVPDPPEPGPANPSPDGETLAFLAADETGETRLWLYAVDGSTRRSVGLPFIPVVDTDGPQWSPDGTWIALTGRRFHAGPSAIWLAPANGGDCIIVANHQASDRQPRWSPDGSLIAFVSHRDGRDTICVSLPAGDGPIIQLTWGLPGQNDSEPTWSDDSSRIAFLRSFIDGETAGDHVWTVSIATGETKQATKKIANRHGLRWNPGKIQVGFITDEGEWLNVGVVNPDNSAGWNLASEAGDKDDPQYNSDGARMLYTRGLKGEVRLGERATSGASADLLDPGMGIASSPRWLPGKRVVYRFAPATGAPHFIVQDAKKDAERSILLPPAEWDAGRPLIVPAFVEIETASGAKLGGLFYRDPAADGLTPAVLLLRDAPYARNDAGFRPVEQALAAAGFAVFVPTMPGSPGLGKKSQSSLRDATSPEADSLLILEIAKAMLEFETVHGDTVALVGEGYGGAQALVLAGARPGSVAAVAAIDPIADWDDEFDQGTPEWRAWQSKFFGLPTLNRGSHALRTPATLAGVIECPLMVIDSGRVSEGRSRQIENLAGILQELDVQHTWLQTQGESRWSTGERAAAFLRETLGPNRLPEPEPAPAAPEPEGDRAEDI
ncbi:MAG: PD40 domain-containing protein [Thermomicrobiales bacterium]|nr:PD40 domain-containing protein [Thermomicrobiales bacterium]